MINVRWIWDTIVAALRFDTSSMESQRDAEDGFAQGLSLIVAIAIVVGLVVGLVGLVGDLTSDPMDEIDEALEGMLDARSMMEEFGMFEDDEEAAESMDLVFANIEAGFEMGKRIAGTVDDTTSAPAAVVHFLMFLGQWVSRVFSWIGTWLVWGVMTLFFARLLGGRATIQRHLAVTSLAAAPMILGVFGWVQCVGGLLGLIAWVWAIAIYVKGTAVANRIGVGAALLAVLAPFIIAAILGLLGLFALGTLVAVAS